MRKTLLFLCLSLSLSNTSFAGAQRDDEGLIDQSSIDQKSEQQKILTHQNKVKSPGGWDLTQTQYDKDTDTVKVEAKKDNVSVSTNVKVQVPALMKWAKKALGFLGNVFDLAKEVLFGASLNDYTPEQNAEIYANRMGRYTYISSQRDGVNFYIIRMTVSGRKNVYTPGDYFYTVRGKDYTTLSQANQAACGSHELVTPAELPSGPLINGSYSVYAYCRYRLKYGGYESYSQHISMSQQLIFNGGSGSNSNLEKIAYSGGRAPANSTEVKAVGDYKRFVAENEFYSGSMDKLLNELQSTALKEAPGTAPEVVPGTAPEVRPTPGTSPSPAPAPGTAPEVVPGTAPEVRPTPGTSPSPAPSPSPSSPSPSTRPAPSPSPAPSTAPSTSPSSSPISSPVRLPAFCSWATVVCDFIIWFKEEPDKRKPEQERPIIEEIELKERPSKFDTDYLLYGGSCPSLDPFSIPIGFGQSMVMQFDISPLCDFAVKVRPAILALAYLMAMMIVARAIQST